MESEHLLHQQKELTTDAIERLKSAVADNHELKSINRRQQAQIEQLENELSTFKQQHESAKEAADKLNKDLMTMTRQYELTYEQLEQTKALQFSLNDANIQVQTFRAKYNEACAELSKLSLEFTAYKSNNQRLEQEQNDEIVNLSIKVQEMEEALLMAQNRFNNAQVMLKEKEIVSKRLEFEAQQNAQQLQIAIQQIADKSRELEEQKNESEAEKDDLRRQVLEKDGEVLELSQELKGEEENLDAVNAEYEKLRTEAPTDKADKRSDRSVLSKQASIEISNSSSADLEAINQKQLSDSELPNDVEVSNSESNSDNEQDEKEESKTSSDAVEEPPETIKPPDPVWAEELLEDIVYLGLFSWKSNYERIIEVVVPNRVRILPAFAETFSIGENAPASPDVSEEADIEPDGRDNESVVYLNAQPASTMRELASTSTSPEVEEIALPSRSAAQLKQEQEEEASESRVDPVLEANRFPIVDEAAKGDSNVEKAIDIQKSSSVQDTPNPEEKKAKIKLFGAKRQKKVQEEDSEQEQSSNSRAASASKKDNAHAKQPSDEQLSVTAEELFNQPQHESDEEFNAPTAESNEDSQPDKRKFKFAFKKKLEKDLDENVDAANEESSESVSQSKSDIEKNKRKISEEELMDTPVLNIEDEGGTRKDKKKQKNVLEPQQDKLKPSFAVKKQ